MTSSAPTRIRTPHAAMVIWNYQDRLGSEETNPATANQVEPLYITTISAVSLSTSKSKGDPQGSFRAVLAPTKNWVGKLTPGSWCAILMSNKPITTKDMEKLDPHKLKMFGKIDTVRLDTKMSEDGTRTTFYYVSGVDWGHVFHNIFYVDNNLTNKYEPQNMAAGPALAIQNILFDKSGYPKSSTTAENLGSLLKIFGEPLGDYNLVAKNAGTGIIPHAVYNFTIPSAVAKYLNLKIPGSSTITPNVNSAIQLITGQLTGYNKYKPTQESKGIVDPFSLQGAHSFWEILQNNSCPVLNEMVVEMRPQADSTSLLLYNRIKPFAIKGAKSTSELKSQPDGGMLVSHFQDILTHTIDPLSIIAINAGTNWKDKYNFAEVKPNWVDERTIEAAVKQQSQLADQNAWDREGFRPMIYGSRYLPASALSSDIQTWSLENFKSWVFALKTWYFNTHKMLNGTLVMAGVEHYIAVGDNIKIDAAIVNPSRNFNGAQAAAKDSTYLLAHVESISNTFSVDANGTRAYRTTIEFVRGVLVNGSGALISDDREAGIDSKSGSISIDSRRNTDNTVTVSEWYDPNPITEMSKK
jgi:hypothetical protein